MPCASIMLCRIERRPPRLDLQNWPHLPLPRVRTTAAADCMEAVAVAVHLQDVDVMGDSVEQSTGEPFGAEHLGPFLERQVAGYKC